MTDASPENPPGKENAAPASGPLTGIKVLDLGTFIAGSYAAVLMGDMGADVIKVEALDGDPARDVGPFLEGEGRSFIGWNRNKRSLAIDLRTGAGREAIYALVRRTDVVTENFRGGVTDRLKIDYATLSGINPSIIYCSSTAFGARGPFRERPAFDGVVQAMGGVAHNNVRTCGTVAVASVLLADFQTAMLSLGAINAALYHRERTGEGQKIETSLLQAVMSIQPPSYCRPVDRDWEGPWGPYPYRMFKTKDHWIFVASARKKFWPLLCEAIGAPELAENPDYQTNPQRSARSEELNAKIEPIFLRKTAGQWETILTGKGVPCAAVLSPEDFFDLPQVEAMEMRPVVQHSTIGPLRLFGVPFHFERTPGRIQRAAPTLGEHNEEILREAGYSEAKIDELKREGVIAK